MNQSWRIRRPFYSLLLQPFVFPCLHGSFPWHYTPVETHWISVDSYWLDRDSTCIASGALKIRQGNFLGCVRNPTYLLCFFVHTFLANS
jgi:hypothetical protein